MAADRVLIERHGRILKVVNNDPKTRNSLSPVFYDGFREAMEEAAGNSDVGAIVLTGAERFFCSGGNLNSIQERRTQDMATRRMGVDKLHDMILTMRNLPKPIIAAVDGGAAGAGASIMAACDLIVGARDAYASVAYIKVGLTPDGGSTAFIGTSVPRHLMAEMLFTGDRVPLERLYQVGLVNRLAEPDQALEMAMEWAEQIGNMPTKALAYGKKLIGASRLNSLKAQLDMEADGIAEAMGGDEAGEGIAAFLEKRKPDWSKTR